MRTFIELYEPKFHKLTKIQEALFMANLPIPKRIETKSFKRSNDFGHVFCDVKKTARLRDRASANFCQGLAEA